MGFSNDSNGAEKFINFKEGKMRNNGMEWKTFEGELIEIEIKPDEYEKVPYQKLILHFWEPEMEQKFEMQMSMTSGYGFAFFAMCPNINPGVPLSVSASMNEREGGHKSGVLFLRQEGKPIKWFYSKENQKELDKIPKAKEVKKATKTAKAIFDYEDRNNFIEKILTNFQTKKLAPLYPKGIAAFKNKAGGKDSNDKNRSTPTDITEPIDDLPF